jgi:hypothetical protein
LSVWAKTPYLEHLRLRVHPAKANIFTVYEGVDVLGYRVFLGFRQLRNDNGHRFARKLRGVSPVPMPKDGWIGRISIPAYKVG